MYLVLLGMYNFASAISHVHCNDIKSSITIELGMQDLHTQYIVDTGPGVLALCYFWVLVYILYRIGALVSTYFISKRKIILVYLTTLCIKSLVNDN